MLYEINIKSLGVATWALEIPAGTADKGGSLPYEVTPSSMECVMSSQCAYQIVIWKTFGLSLTSRQGDANGEGTTLGVSAICGGVTLSSPEESAGDRLGTARFVPRNKG